MFHKPFMGFLKHFRVFKRRLKMLQCRFREFKGIKEEFRLGEFQGRSRGYQDALSGLLRSKNSFGMQTKTSYRFLRNIHAK